MLTDFNRGGQISARYHDIVITPQVRKIIVTRQHPEIEIPSDPAGQVWSGPSPMGVEIMYAPNKLYIV